VAAGYLASILWLKTQRLAMGLSEDDFWKLIYAVFFGAIAGGKLLYLAVEYKALLSDPLSLLKGFRYGFVFFGGLLGAMAMGLWAKRAVGFDYLALADYFGTALPLGHALGRLGCLGAGCCYGRPTDLPWGLALGGHRASSTPMELWGIPLHPAQLYESLACLAIFFLLLRWALPRVKAGLWPRGRVFLSYLMLYSAARFFIEFYRFDDRGASPAPFSISQWIALAFLAGSGAFLIGRWRRR
jgi:phosphatidylglycerol:prolipoprotein diacylglycerol transferase